MKSPGNTIVACLLFMEAAGRNRRGEVMPGQPIEIRETTNAEKCPRNEKEGLR